MKTKRISFILILSLLVTVLTGCAKEENLPYGTRISEDLETMNVVDDNYRNYYEIFVRSFNDSNNDGIGDLKGVINKLDYIQDLGFTGIWLMPINPSTSYHKYNVSDYYNVDSSYGTIDDLKNLITECHNRNIKLILDLVLNHSGTDCAYFTKATIAYRRYMSGYELTEEENKYKDFYSFYASRDEVPNGVTAYRITGTDHYYEANFDSGMPEFNIDSEYVREEFKKIIKFYIDLGIDGFRLDAVKYYYYNNTQKNVEFLRDLNSWVKGYKSDAYVVGECFDSYSMIQDYYESGLDSFFNFNVSVNNSTSPILNSTNREGSALQQYYNGLLSNETIGGIPAPFLDNHDMNRFTSTNLNNINLNKFRFALLQMMNGSSFTYYGSEVGMIGSIPTDQNVRIPIKWGDEDNNDCTLISGTTKVEYIYPTVSEQMSDESSIYNFYKKVLLIRNQNPEIARGTTELITVERDTTKLLFISKTYNGSKIGLIFNFSATLDLTVDYKSQGFSSVVGQMVTDTEKYIGSNADGSINLPPYSIAIVK